MKNAENSGGVTAVSLSGISQTSNLIIPGLNLMYGQSDCWFNCSWIFNVVVIKTMHHMQECIYSTHVLLTAPTSTINTGQLTILKLAVCVLYRWYVHTWLNTAPTWYVYNNYMSLGVQCTIVVSTHAQETTHKLWIGWLSEVPSVRWWSVYHLCFLRRHRWSDCANCKGCSALGEPVGVTVGQSIVKESVSRGLSATK